MNPEWLKNEGTVLLDAAGKGASYLFRDPVDVVVAEKIEDVKGALLQVDKHLEAGLYVAGYMAYEAGFAFEPERFRAEFQRDYSMELGYPILWFGVYSERTEVENYPDFGSGVIEDLSDTAASGAFQQAVVAIRRLIAEGDVYQINNTTRFQGHLKGSASGLYGELRTRQPVQYGAYLNVPGTELISLSPELFFKRDARRVAARPMKGTAPRGGSEKEDEVIRTWLKNDTKNRAENLMIVDLLRNDLSQVCVPGSVVVDDLFHVEKYSILFQMTSSVHGILKSDIQLSDIFSSLFPCGSITGAPKIRAMKRISELEDSPRGIYCGTIGYAGPGDNGEAEAVFSVAIRTASVSGDLVTYGTGGGIVWDSDPDSEYDEAKLKVQFVTGSGDGAFSLIETMRCDRGIRLIGFHLDRLESSAEKFGYVFDRNRVQAGIEAYCAKLDGNTVHRVRSLLSRDGKLAITSIEISEVEVPLRIGMAGILISSSNPIRQHKTTKREVLDRALARAHARNLYDVLLINEKGEVTEGAITNIFARFDGQWYTPPVSSGLLPGVGRRDFMLHAGARERVLTSHMLSSAEELVVTNAVIGARTAIWMED